MSAQRSYVFGTPAQWQQCLLHRFEAAADGSLTPAARLGTYAALIAPPPRTATQAFCVDALGQTIWLTDASGPLGRSPRIIADRAWIWAFESGGTVVRRADRGTLQLDLDIDTGMPVRDIAGDGHEGIWVLCEGPFLSLLRFDCEGRPRERNRVPFEAANATQIASSKQGLALLSDGAKTLVFVDGATGQTQQIKDFGSLAPGWNVTQLTSDANDRIALWGTQPPASNPVGVLFVLDGSGDTLDGPMSGMFNRPDGPQPPRSLDSIRIAAYGESVWFASDAGLWRLSPSDAATDSASARESESYLTTPALFSPATGAERGWLRAEVSLDLSQGAALEVSVGTTNDQQVYKEAQATFGDASQSSEQIQAALWAFLIGNEKSTVYTYTIPGPAQAAAPLAIPVLASEDQWLWLRVAVITPPGTAPSPVRQLRMLYPNLSIIYSLPAIFRGSKNDPTATFRTLTGVLESTAQQFDERIRNAASYLDARTAPEEWLNYLARWFDLPWDDGLPLDAKRGILLRAGDLLDGRGGRAGLRVLLECLVGADAKIEVADITADYSLIRLGGCGQNIATLPALLAGSSLLTPTLGAKAVLGRARLCGDQGSLATIVPALRIRITAPGDVRRGIESLLRRLLLQYVPAGMVLSVRWQDVELAAPDMIGDNGIVIGGLETGALGRNSAVGRSKIGGRNRARIDETGFEMGKLQ